MFQATKLQNLPDLIALFIELSIYKLINESSTYDVSQSSSEYQFNTRKIDI